MQIKRILIIGGTSSIGFEVAKKFALDGAKIAITGRNIDLLKKNCDILNQLGAKKVESIQLDVLDYRKHSTITKKISASLGGLDGVLISYGVAYSQAIMEKDPSIAINEIETNLCSTVSILMHIAEYFKKQSRGVIAVITSVAGEKGRREQHIYACTKSGLSTFLEGYRHRLVPYGIRVLNIKPGLTETPLTKSINTPLRKILFSKAEHVGKIIYKAMQNGNGIIWVPSYWKWLLFIVKHIPDSIFWIYKKGVLFEQTNKK